MSNDPKIDKHYLVIAREEYKEEDFLFYQGNYSLKQLKNMATDEVRENTIMEYENIEDCYVHIDYVFQSDTPITFKEYRDF
mgnify:CR=1 FL=1|tara:strand:+ start:543 stop:785 length:243 start_codon:yes stop_codon:yes gene_type:complete